MKTNNFQKEYKVPQFQIVKPDESNKVFFAASGAPAGPSLTGGINTMTVNNGSAWE